MAVPGTVHCVPGTVHCSVRTLSLCYLGSEIIIPEIQITMTEIILWTTNLKNSNNEKIDMEKWYVGTKVRTAGNKV